MDRSSSDIAVLVDIENIRISIELETAIVKMFPSVDIVKIAVGNWKLLNLDRELQSRGYHLFHVPTGRDNADREILNLSWLIKDCRELVIVSNDKIFIQLVHQFNSGSKTTYIVYRSRSQFIITKSQILVVEEQKILPTTQPIITVQAQSSPVARKAQKLEHTDTIDKSNQFTSQSELIQVFKKLAIENRSINTPQHLATEFHKKFGVKASSAIASCQILGSFNKFITDNKILSILQTREKLAIDIKKILDAHPTIAKDSAQVGTKFKQMYGVSITEQMKSIGITGKSSKFIAQLQLGHNPDHN
jgi:hypothetical protein